LEDEGHVDGARRGIDEITNHKRYREVVRVV
jgi:hypothetical protein